jgi:hypothetical protein
MTHQPDCASLQAELTRQEYGIHLCICPTLNAAELRGYERGNRESCSQRHINDLDTWMIRQHPGRECCESCTQDYEYDGYLTFDYLCCCRSEADDDKEAVIALAQQYIREDT